MPTRRLMTAGALLLGAGFGLTGVAAAAEAVPCRDDPAYAKLDFWVRRWEVFDSAGKKQGNNLIEIVLASCGIVENWTAADGSQGRSLFHYLRSKGRWKQVWVTDKGFVKEKAELLEYPGPGLRFQGALPHPPGRRCSTARRSRGSRTVGCARSSSCRATAETPGLPGRGSPCEWKWRRPLGIVSQHVVHSQGGSCGPPLPAGEGWGEGRSCLGCRRPE